MAFCGKTDHSNQVFTVKVDGVDYINTDLKLDHVVLNRDIMLKFLWWCKCHFCSENILFWLEAQLFKYLEHDNEIAEQLDYIIDKYITEDILNIDEPVLIRNLESKRGVPDRTVLLPIQNAIWNLLKYESFVKFKVEEGKNIRNPVDKTLMAKIEEWNEDSIRYLDDFLEKVIETLAYEDFNPNTIPRDKYEEDKKMNQAPFEEIWMDKYLMLGFREYLHRQFASEYLTCYYKIKYFYHFADEETMEDLAHEIYSTYFSSTATQGIAVEHSLVEQIEEYLDKPKRKMFSNVLKFVENRLKVDLYPSFQSSTLYRETNANTLEYQMSDKKGNTVKVYKALLPIFRGEDEF